MLYQKPFHMCKKICLIGVTAALLSVPFYGSHADDSLNRAVTADYTAHLADLFTWFHQNPELSYYETETAKRLAAELKSAGFVVTEKIAGTGVVAILENGPGPLVMMRADMDGLPVEEKSGLPYASRKQQKDSSGNTVYVMHACGHDVHITSLVGTARAMAARKSDWSGTLMLIGQPAEERVGGAKSMMDAGLWSQFGQPDYAMAFHVNSELPAGKLIAVEGSPFSGADTVDIAIQGIGAHGASPHAGIDPIVLGSQIVMGLQTIVSRTLPPREAGVITVGSFHAGTKHNIISDKAHLQLTVRNDNLETRKTLLDGIKRIAVNMGRVAGLPEDKLPQVTISSESVPPTINDIPLTRRLKNQWRMALGDDILVDINRQGMGAEDFPFFTTDPYIPSTYFIVGGASEQDLALAESGKRSIPSHHSPLFRIDPKESVILGVEATVIGLIELLNGETKPTPHASSAVSSGLASHLSPGD